MRTHSGKRQITSHQFLQFGVVGVLNTGIDFLVFVALIRLAHWNFVWAQVASYTMGLINSYIWNQRLTFRQKVRLQPIQLTKFVALNGLSYIISTTGLFMLNQFAWPLMLAKLAITALTMIVNFAGSKWWVFRETCWETAVR